jgi:hypothetical protein
MDHITSKIDLIKNETETFADNYRILKEAFEIFKNCG